MDNRTLSACVNGLNDEVVEYFLLIINCNKLMNIPMTSPTQQKSNKTQWGRLWGCCNKK